LIISKCVSRLNLAIQMLSSCIPVCSIRCCCCFIPLSLSLSLSLLGYDTRSSHLTSSFLIQYNLYVHICLHECFRSLYSQSSPLKSISFKIDWLTRRFSFSSPPLDYNQNHLTKKYSILQYVRSLTAHHSRRSFLLIRRPCVLDSANQIAR
jgi:hypothetical protein